VLPGSAFDYACTLHPVMTGRVELTAAHAGLRNPPRK
jgi:hypothetical protein